MERIMARRVWKIALVAAATLAVFAGALSVATWETARAPSFIGDALPPLPPFPPTTLVGTPVTYGYILDCQLIPYFNEEPPPSGGGCAGDVYYFNNGVSELIPGADGATFTILHEGYGYAKDTSSVYFKTSVVEGADPNTFELVFGENYVNGKYAYAYAKDAHHVYDMCTGDRIVGVDPTTIELSCASMDPFEGKIALAPSYFIHDNFVYFSSDVIPGADPDTFEIIDEAGIAKDEQNVYLGTGVLAQADPGTFELLDQGYARDMHRVYFKTVVGIEVHEGADPNTFEVIGYTYTKDKNKVYRRIDDVTIVVVPGADPSTFELVIENIKSPIVEYAKDAKHVYVYGYDAKYKPELVVLEGADPETFDEIALFGFPSFHFWKDKQNVYFRGNGSVDEIAVVANADPVTFASLYLPSYYADKDTVWYVGPAAAESFGDIKLFELKGADPALFAIIQPVIYATDGTEVYYESGYATDGTNVYFLDELVPDADAATFSILYEDGDKSLPTAFAYDAAHVYYGMHVLGKLNPVETEYLGHGYVSDGVHIYFRWWELVGADVATFTYVGTKGEKEGAPHFSKDASHVYKNGALVQGADPNTCIPITLWDVSGCEAP